MTINTYLFPRSPKGFFICHDTVISGQQWAQECIALAQDISSYKEQSWLLYHDDFYQYSVLFFALLIAKKNIVLAQGNQSERLKQAANFADISIGDFELKKNAKELIPHFKKSINQRVKSSLAKLTIDENTNITLFTSGSSGKAKAIKKYWYQLASEVETLQALFPHTKNNVIATVTHKHIYGLLFKLIWPVFTDKNIICQCIEYPEQVELFTQQYSNILLVSSPSYLARTSHQFSSQAINAIDEIFCSGGALATSTAEDFFQFNQQAITEVYGSTETGGIAWRQQARSALWQLFPEHQVSLTSQNTLLLQSRFLAKGEYYETDDSVELNGRFFTLLGRVDRIIKLHEKRLSLDEMETKLTSLTNVKACRCFILDNSLSKTTLVAVIELPATTLIPKSNIEKKQLVNLLKKALSTTFEASLLPRKWRFVEQLPFNSEGKLVKSELSKLFK
ncbi:AMP-binding protein [Colwellia sp. RSH04]|uniref:AMP-binding protein n=1 Tax=Colwellia sp. RSH04 TaxID=2305464 RepID=UPI000E569580|nr:AMP-binding protein [Colwellia sp. RSH04]RHW75789.1 hypothetical protein D1094_11765 [Colwellia sp. RSH04]